MTTIYTSKKRKEFSEATGTYEIEDLVKIKELKNYKFDYDIKNNGDLIIIAYNKNESNIKIYPDLFQIIPITSEMKAKYPALKKYKELIISGKEINWFDADEYAKKNRAVLPDSKDEGKQVWRLVREARGNKKSFFEFWTRDNYFGPDEAYYVDSNGMTFTNDDKTEKYYCFCLR